MLVQGLQAASQPCLGAQGGLAGLRGVGGLEDGEHVVADQLEDAAAAALAVARRSGPARERTYLPAWNGPGRDVRQRGKARAELAGGAIGSDVAGIVLGAAD